MHWYDQHQSEKYPVVHIPNADSCVIQGSQIVAQSFKKNRSIIAMVLYLYQYNDRIQVSNINMVPPILATK